MRMPNILKKVSVSNEGLSLPEVLDLCSEYEGQIMLLKLEREKLLLAAKQADNLLRRCGVLDGFLIKTIREAGKP